MAKSCPAAEALVTSQEFFPRLRCNGFVVALSICQLAMTFAAYVLLASPVQDFPESSAASWILRIDAIIAVDDKMRQGWRPGFGIGRLSPDQPRPSRCPPAPSDHRRRASQPTPPPWSRHRRITRFVVPGGGTIALWSPASGRSLVLGLGLPPDPVKGVRRAERLAAAPTAVDPRRSRIFYPAFPGALGWRWCVPRDCDRPDCRLRWVLLRLFRLWCAQKFFPTRRLPPSKLSSSLCLTEARGSPAPWKNAGP